LTALSAPPRRRAGIVLLTALCAVYVLLAALPAAPGSNLVLATAGGSPGWLLGPLRFAGLDGADGSLAGPLFYAGLWLALLLYAGLLALRPPLTWRVALWIVVGLHALFMLAPPLLSQDVFSYLAYARLGALHHLDPYTHSPSDIPADPVFGFAGSKDAESAYGPLFTLATYPLARIGVPTGFWLLKIAMAGASLGVAMLARRVAERLGRDGVSAFVFVGLNPIVLVHVVGGAHNEALVVLLTMIGVLVFVSSSEPRGTGLAALAAGVKASAAVPVPFLVAAARRHTPALAAAALAALLVAAVALLGFGSHALDALGLLGSNQERTSRFSFPYKTAELLGWLLPGDRLDYRGAVRTVFALAGVAVVAWLLVKTWRGADPLAMAAWATLAVLVASAWLVPWYLLWLLPLAAIAGGRRLLVATIVLCAWTLAIAVPL
jgi:glycosyl transferase family 87